MNVYKVTELIVIKLAAGNDRNGNSRTVLVLTHPLDGFIDTTTEGSAGESAVRDFGFEAFTADRDQINRELIARITTKIDTSPSYYRHMASKRNVSTVPYRIEL